MKNSTKMNAYALFALPILLMIPLRATAQSPPALGGNALVFIAITPCRLVDTRVGQGFSGEFGPPFLAARTSRTFPVASTSSTCTIPSIAQAYSLNLTVVPHGALGFVTAYPTGQRLPLAATVNSPQGYIVGNATVVAAGDSGSVDVYASDSTDVVIDINGYYTKGSDTYSTIAFGEDALPSRFGPAVPGYRGVQNVAIGNKAMGTNLQGSQNVAIGSFALYANSTGSGNVAIGSNAGVNTTGSGNILVSNDGLANESFTIRIGEGRRQSRAFLAGVWGTATGSPGAVSVVIDSNGQLGTINSSRRFKTDIADMGDASSGLRRLRPVTYRHRSAYADGSNPIDYGLIAEEVAEVYPDLVVTGPEGQVATVQYNKLIPMLLNELKKAYQHQEQQLEMIRLLQTRISALEAVQSRQNER